MDRFTNPYVFIAEFSPDNASKVEWLTELRPQTRAAAPDPTARYKYTPLCSHPVTETSFDDAVRWRGSLIRCDDEEAAHTNFDDDENVRPVSVDTELWPAMAALLDNDCECLFRCFMYRDAVSVAKCRESQSSYTPAGAGSSNGNTAGGRSHHRHHNRVRSGSPIMNQQQQPQMPLSSRFAEFRAVAGRIFAEVPQPSSQDVVAHQQQQHKVAEAPSPFLATPTPTPAAAIPHLPSSATSTEHSTVSFDAALSTPAPSTTPFQVKSAAAASSSSPSAQHKQAPEIQILCFTEPLLDGATVLSCVFQIRDPDVRAQTRSLAIALCHPDFNVVARHAPRIVDGLIAFAQTMIKDSHRLPKELASGQRFEPVPLFTRFASSWPEQQQQQQQQNVSSSATVVSGPPQARSSSQQQQQQRQHLHNRNGNHHEDDDTNSDRLSSHRTEPGTAFAGSVVLASSTSARARPGYVNAKRKMRLLSTTMAQWHYAFVNLLSLVVGPPLNPMQGLMLSSVRPLAPGSSSLSSTQQYYPQDGSLFTFPNSNSNNSPRLISGNDSPTIGFPSAATTTFFWNPSAAGAPTMPRNGSSSNLFGSSSNLWGLNNTLLDGTTNSINAINNTNNNNTFGTPPLAGGGRLLSHPMWTEDLVRALKERDAGFRLTLLALRRVEDIAKSAAETAAAFARRHREQCQKELSELKRQSNFAPANSSNSAPSDAAAAFGGPGGARARTKQAINSKSQHQYLVQQLEQQIQQATLEEEAAMNPQHQLHRQAHYLNADAVSLSQLNILTEVLSALFKGELVLILPNSEQDARLAGEIAAALASLLPPHTRKVAVDVPCRRIKTEESKFTLISVRWSNDIPENFLKCDNVVPAPAAATTAESSQSSSMTKQPSTPSKANSPTALLQPQEQQRALSQENVARLTAETVAAAALSPSRDQPKQQQQQYYTPRVGSVVIQVSEAGVTRCRTSEGSLKDLGGPNGGSGDIDPPSSVPCIADTVAQKIALTPPDEPLRVALSPVLEVMLKISNSYVAMLSQFLNNPLSSGGGGGGAAGGNNNNNSSNNNNASFSARRNRANSVSNNNNAQSVSNASFSSNPNNYRDTDALSDSGFSGLGNDSFDNRVKALLNRSVTHFDDDNGSNRNNNKNNNNNNNNNNRSDDDDDDESTINVKESFFSKIKSFFRSASALDEKKLSENDRRYEGFDTQSQVSLPAVRPQLQQQQQHQQQQQQQRHERAIVSAFSAPPVADQQRTRKAPQINANPSPAPSSSLQQQHQQTGAVSASSSAAASPSLLQRAQNINNNNNNNNNTHDMVILTALLKNTIPIEEIMNDADAQGRQPKPRLSPAEALALVHKLDSHVGSHFFWTMFRAPSAADFVAMMNLARRKRSSLPGTGDES